MRTGQRGRREKFDREISVRHRIERIGGRAVETQRLSGHFAVDRKGGAGQGGGAERAFVEPAPAVGKPAAIAPDHLDIGHQMMPEGDRLGDLQMGEAGHYRLGMRVGLVEQRGLDLLHRRVDALYRAADPEPEIGRDLVVARARGVQPPSRRPDQLGETRFDVQVDVLIGLAEREGAGVDLLPNLL